MEYRTVTIAKKIVSWTAASGQKIEITVSLDDNQIDFGTGAWKSDKISVETRVSVAGSYASLEQVMSITPVTSRTGAVLVARIGNVGLTADQAAAIAAAKAEMESLPEWRAVIEKGRKTEAGAAQYRAHQAAMKSAMCDDSSTYRR